jgi:hypothetical protein
MKRQSIRIDWFRKARKLVEIIDHIPNTERYDDVLPARDPRAPAALPARNFLRKVADSGSAAPKATLMGSYRPKRRDVYEASRNQAAFTPFHRAATPSSPAILVVEPTIPSFPYSAETWIRVYQVQQRQGVRQMDVLSNHKRNASVVAMKAVESRYIIRWVSLLVDGRHAVTVTTPFQTLSR